MALFSSKKEIPKPLKIEKLPSLPEFPDLPDDTHFDELPAYESSIGSVKQGVEKAPSFDIPKRESPMKPTLVEAHPDTDKPLFVKIDKYKEAIGEMNKLKEKLSQAEDLLNEMDDIRQREGDKLETWKRDIASLKEKLLSVDQHLFEV